MGVFTQALSGMMIAGAATEVAADNIPSVAGNALPGHETLAAHARATVEADGAPAWPEGLVEAVARGMARSNGWRWTMDEGATNMVDFAHGGQPTQRSRNWWRNNATAALSAIRAWEGRE